MSMVPGVSVQVSGSRNSGVGMRKIRKGAGCVPAIESNFFRPRPHARPHESAF